MKTGHAVKKYIFVFCLIALSVIALSGEENKEPAQGMIFRPSSPFVSEDSESGNLTALLQENAAGTAVKIETDVLKGSGIIFHMDEDTVTIVTAGHILTGWHNLAVTFSDGCVFQGISRENTNGAQISVSESSDLAVIKLPASQLPESTLENCRYAAADKKSFDAMQAGDILLVLGSVNEPADSAYAGLLLEPWIYIEDFGQYMMLAQVYACAGMSGGGVFNQQGYFIGLICGKNEQGELAVLPFSIILAETADL